MTRPWDRLPMNCFRVCVGLLLLSAFSASISFAGEVSHLLYSMPSNAIVTGPSSVWGRDGWTFTRHYSPDSDINSPRDMSEESVDLQLAPERDLIGIKTFSSNTLVGVELFLDGNRHGVQREWHENGSRKSEQPYRHGRLDGDCRSWDETGLLVGWYAISNGTGVVKRYYTNGVLSKAKVLVDGLANGRTVRCHKNGEIANWVTFKSECFVGIGVSFRADGSISSWSNSKSPGEKLHGPMIGFGQGGEVEEISYWVDGDEVTKPQYLVAMTTHADLLQLPEDTGEYHALVMTAALRSELGDFRDALESRVQIPLTAKTDDVLP